MQYIVLDLEFNQPFPFRTGEVTILEPECPIEIIQIGAVKLNEQYEICESFNFMIKPMIYKRLHPYVEKITGIHLNQLIDCPPFPDAYKAFLSFIGEKNSVLCTWGIDDIKSLYKNILYYDLDVEKLTNKYINVQSYASNHLNIEAGKNIGLKNAITELNLEISSPFHNALYDAEYTARIFQVVCPKKIQADTFQILDIANKKPPHTIIDIRGLLLHMENKLNRGLTEDEITLVIAAYKLGKSYAYEKHPKKRMKKPSTTR